MHAPDPQRPDAAAYPTLRSGSRLLAPGLRARSNRHHQAETELALLSHARACRDRLLALVTPDLSITRSPSRALTFRRAAFRASIQTFSIPRLRPGGPDVFHRPLPKAARSRFDALPSEPQPRRFPSPRLRRGALTFSIARFRSR